MDYFRSQADKVFQDQKGFLKTDLSGNQMKHLHVLPSVHIRKKEGGLQKRLDKST